MTVSTSLPALLPSQQPAATKDKRIRVRTYTDVRLSARRMNLRKDMDPQTYILWDAVMELFNESVDGIRFPEERDLTTKSIIAEGGAPSRKSFFRTRQKLSEFKINGKPLVAITGGSNRGRDTRYTFKIHWNLLPYSGKPVHLPVATAETEPSRKRDGQNDFPPNPPIMILDPRKERKEPKPDLPVVITGKDPATVPAQVLGSVFEIVKIEELELFRSIVRYGVNKTIITKAFMDMGEPWVNRIYREFNTDVQQTHKMESGVKVLAARLKDYSENWRMQERQPVRQVAQDRIDYWQDVIDENHINKPESLFFIVRQISTEQQMPLKDILPLFNTYNAEV